MISTKKHFLFSALIVTILILISGCQLGYNEKASVSVTESTVISSAEQSSNTVVTTTQQTTVQQTTTVTALKTAITTVPQTAPANAATAAVTTKKPAPVTTIAPAPKLTAPKVTTAPPQTAKPIVTTAATSTAVNVQPKQLSPITSSYVYRTLSGNQKIIYENLRDSIKSFAPSITFSSYQPTVNEFKTIFGYILYNEPTLQYVSTSFSYMGNPIRTVYLTYEDSKAQVDAMQAAVDQKVNTILGGITPAMSQYDIAKYLHDSIIIGCTYDTTTKYSDQMYGALIEGKAHCQGYSFTYMYLCQKAGIDCTTVVGNAKGEHMWNMNLIDGKWYHTDVTWDDQDKQTVFKSPFYNYFNMSSADIQPFRTIYPDNPIPSPAVSNDANFFVKNKYCANSLESGKTILYNQIVAALKSNSKSQPINVRCLDTNTYLALKNNLITNQGIFTLFDYAVTDTGVSSSSSSLKYICDDDMKIITFVFL